MRQSGLQWHRHLLVLSLIAVSALGACQCSAPAPPASFSVFLQVDAILDGSQVRGTVVRSDGTDPPPVGKSVVMAFRAIDVPPAQQSGAKDLIRTMIEEAAPIDYHLSCNVVSQPGATDLAGRCQFALAAKPLDSGNCGMWLGHTDKDGIYHPNISAMLLQWGLALMDREEMERWQREDSQAAGLDALFVRWMNHADQWHCGLWRVA